jgi:hypothetical protein
MVEDVCFNEGAKRICFRFQINKDTCLEWIDFKSPRICVYKSKTVRKAVAANPALAVANAMLPNDTNEERNDDFCKRTLNSLRYESAIVPNRNGRWNENGMKFPPSYDKNAECYSSSKTPDSDVPSHLVDVNKNGNGSSTNNPFASASLIPQQSSDNMSPPPDVSSCTSDDNQRLQQRCTDSSVALPIKASEASILYDPALSTHRSSDTGRTGGLPTGWSGLDMLAAVTFDAAMSTGRIDTPSPAYIASNNTNFVASGPSYMISNGGDSNHRFHDEMRQYPEHAPSWPQQFEPHQPQPQSQQWFPLHTVAVAQAAIQVPSTFNPNGGRNYVNGGGFQQQHGPQLQQQQQQQFQYTFNGDSQTSNHQLNSRWQR